MLTLKGSALSALATFLRTAPEPTTAPPPTVRKRAMTEEEQAAYSVMPLMLPSSADPIHAAMSASNPDEWADVPDGVVDLTGLI